MINEYGPPLYCGNDLIKEVSGKKITGTVKHSFRIEGRGSDKERTIAQEKRDTFTVWWCLSYRVLYSSGGVSITYIIKGIVYLQSCACD